MSSSNDIRTLYRRFGGEPDSYQEVVRERQIGLASGKWPMLGQIDLQNPPPIPHIQRTLYPTPIEATIGPGKPPSAPSETAAPPLAQVASVVASPIPIPASIPVPIPAPVPAPPLPPPALAPNHRLARAPTSALAPIEEYRAHPPVEAQYSAIKMDAPSAIQATAPLRESTPASSAEPAPAAIPVVLPPPAPATPSVAAPTVPPLATTHPSHPASSHPAPSRRAQAQPNRARAPAAVRPLDGTAQAPTLLGLFDRLAANPANPPARKGVLRKRFDK